MWYDKGLCLSFNKILNFILSNRGGGKTFHCTQWCIDDFKKTGSMAVWVRRYSTELKGNEANPGILDDNAFFKAVIKEGLYPDDKLEIKGNMGYINDKPAIYFVSLSTSRSLKSINFPTVNKIIFDEFLIDKGRISYLKNEAEVFLDLFETVARLRDNVRAVFLANSVSVVNPYFTYFKIKPNPAKRFNVYPKGICVEFFTDTDFIAAKKKTRFGKLIEGTRYSDYSIENRWLNDNDTFVETKPKNGCQFHMGLKFNGQMFGFWINYDRGLIFVNKQYDPCHYALYTLTKEDHEPNLLLIKSLKESKPMEMVVYAYNNSLLRFEDMETKSIMYEVLGLFVR